MTDIPKQSRPAEPSAGRRLGAFLFLGALFVGVLFTGIGLRNEIDSLRSSTTDNVEWSVSQLDVDLLGLQVAIRDLRLGRSTVADVRKRYDIFYSRVQTLSRGRGFTELRSVDTFNNDLTTLQAFLKEATPLIDLPDGELVTKIDGFDARLSEIRNTVRSLSTNGVKVFAESMFRQRERFVDALWTSMLVGLGLILLLGVSLVILDRQRRLAQRTARESERNRKRLVATNAAALEAIIVADHRGRIIDWNPGAQKIFGYDAAQALGIDMSELIIPPQYREAHRNGMARFLKTGEKRVIDAGRVVLSALRSDGSEFPVELAIAMTETEDGPIFISYMRDISKRVATRAELTEARDAAMAADRAKSEFLAVMSHEMRTPLNGVLGVMDLLARTDLTAEQRRHVETATLSGEVLLRHVGDVLDITRIEAGRMDFERQPVRLEDVVEQVLEIATPLAETNGNSIGTRIDAGLKPVLSDPHRLRQVLLNLAGNAAKFTRNGMISVEVSVLECSESELEVEVSVHNPGPAIPAEDRARIFEDFVTLDASYNRAQGGSGLGLAISKRIIESLSGQIGLDTGNGDGNRFWFRLRMPLADVDDLDAPVSDGYTPQTGEAPASTILLVEDNEINRDIVRTMLSHAGHHVIEAVNGREAIILAQTSRFDLILMDISMPEVTGLEATQRIRSGSGLSRDVPIIGLTAHAMPDELQAFSDAGMQFCLTKPVRRDTLLSMIAEVLGAHAPSAPEHAFIDPAAELIDEDVFSDLVIALSPTELSSTLGRFTYEVQHGVDELRPLLSAGDLDAFQKQVHHLAGSCAIVGASGLQRRFAGIELACKQNAMDDVDGLLGDLGPILIQTTRTLSEFMDQP